MSRDIASSGRRDSNPRPPPWQGSWNRPRMSADVSLQVTGVPPRGGHTRTVTNRRGLTNIGREIGRDGHQARSATSSACQQDWAEAVTQDLANQDASWPSTNFCRFPPDNPKGEQTASADDNS